MRPRYEGQAALDLAWSEWPDFTPDEVRCKGTGKLVVFPDTMTRLQSMRTYLGFPLQLSSFYRDPVYNNEVSSTGFNGPHTLGAFDILCYGERAYAILSAAPHFEFTGIGISQKGPHNSRFIHLDDLKPEESGGPRPWTWSY